MLMKDWGCYRPHGCQGEPSSDYHSGGTLMSQRIEILRTGHVQFSLVGVECFTGQTTTHPNVYTQLLKSRAGHSFSTIP
jgi:hypothetical protein